MPTVISSLTDRPFWKETVYAESPDGWHSEVRCRFPTPAEIKEAFQRLEQMLFAFSGAIPEPSGGDTWKSSHAKAHPRAMWPKFYKFHEGDYFEIYTRYQLLAKGEYAGYGGPPLKPRSQSQAVQFANGQHDARVHSVSHNQDAFPHDPRTDTDLLFTLEIEQTDLNPTGNVMRWRKKPKNGSWGALNEVPITPPDFPEARIASSEIERHDEFEVYFTFSYDVGDVVEPLGADDPSNRYRYVACDHVNPYGGGLPEFITEEDDDHWDFEQCVRLPPQLINLARWALYYLGRWVEHDPRTRGSGNSCCWKENVFWRWTGSNQPGHYIAGGKGASDGAYPYASTTLHELTGGSAQKRKWWRGAKRNVYVNPDQPPVPPLILQGWPCDPERTSQHYHGGNESWLPLPYQACRKEEMVCDDNADAIDYRDRGLQNCDEVTAEHWREIVDSINWLWHNGLWQSEEDLLRVRSATVTQAFDHPCGLYQTPSQDYPTAECESGNECYECIHHYEPDPGYWWWEWYPIAAPSTQECTAPDWQHTDPEAPGYHQRNNQVCGYQYFWKHTFSGQDFKDSDCSNVGYGTNYPYRAGVKGCCYYGEQHVDTYHGWPYYESGPDCGMCYAFPEPAGANHYGIRGYAYWLCGPPRFKNCGADGNGNPFCPADASQQQTHGNYWRDLPTGIQPASYPCWSQSYIAGDPPGDFQATSLGNGFDKVYYCHDRQYNTAGEPLPEPDFGQVVKVGWDGVAPNWKDAGAGACGAGEGRWNAPDIPGLGGLEALEGSPNYGGLYHHVCFNSCSDGSGHGRGCVVWEGHFPIVYGWLCKPRAAYRRIEVPELGDDPIDPAYPSEADWGRCYPDHYCAEVGGA